MRSSTWFAHGQRTKREVREAREVAAAQHGIEIGDRGRRRVGAEIDRQRLELGRDQLAEIAQDRGRHAGGRERRVAQRGQDERTDVERVAGDELAHVREPRAHRLEPHAARRRHDVELAQRRRRVGGDPLGHAREVVGGRRDVAVEVIARRGRRPARIPEREHDEEAARRVREHQLHDVGERDARRLALGDHGERRRRAGRKRCG